MDAEVVELHADIVSSAVTPGTLKLTLEHGSSFSVLLDDQSVQTCYTDRGGTSRSSECSVAALIEFAQTVLRHFSANEAESVAA